MINRIRRALARRHDLTGLRVHCEHVFNEANRNIAEDMRQLVAKSSFEKTLNHSIFIKQAIRIVASRAIEATTKAMTAVDNMPGRFEDHGPGRDHVRRMIAAFYKANSEPALAAARRAGRAAEEKAQERLDQAQAEAQSLVNLNRTGLHKPDDEWNRRYLQFSPIVALVLTVVGLAKCAK